MPWYGVEVEVEVVSYDCLDYYLSLREFDDAITIYAAVDPITSDPNCHEGPNVRDIPRTESKLEFIAQTMVLTVLKREGNLSERKEEKESVKPRRILVVSTT